MHLTSQRGAMQHLALTTVIIRNQTLVYNGTLQIL